MILFEACLRLFDLFDSFLFVCVFVFVCLFLFVDSCLSSVIVAMLGVCLFDRSFVRSFVCLFV